MAGFKRKIVSLARENNMKIYRPEEFKPQEGNKEEIMVYTEISSNGDTFEECVGCITTDNTLGVFETRVSEKFWDLKCFTSEPEVMIKEIIKAKEKIS